MSDARPTRPHWLLKVIAGPHQGAELEIAPGKSLIGSDDGCDVVLHDVLVAPQHVAIDASEKALHLEPLGGRVYFGGKRVRETRQKLEPFTFVTLGGTHLVIGPVGAKWPLLSAADVPELEKEAPEPDAPLEETSAAEPAAKPEAPKPAAAPSDMPSPARRRAAWLAAGMGAILLIGWAIVFNLWKSNFPVPGQADPAAEAPVAAAPDDLMARAKAALEKLGATDVIRLESQAGRVTALGYVETDSRQREIEKVLRQEASGVVPRIWSLERMASAARTLLVNRGIKGDVEAKPEGVLSVVALVEKHSDWPKIRELLTSEIPGVTKIADTIRTREEIASVPPAPPLSHTPAPSLPPSPAPATPAPKVPAPSGPAPFFRTVDGPEATIAEIVARPNGLGFVRASTGGVYFTGARLPFGGVVSTISEKSVTIDTGNGSRDLSVGDRLRPTEPEPPAEPAPTTTQNQ